MGHRYATPPTCSSGWRCRRIGEVAEFAMSRPGGAVTVRAARNASRPRATVPGTKPPGIRAREGHLQSATHSCVTYGPYVTQSRKEGPHMSTKSASRADLDAEDRKTPWRKTESEWRD